MFSNLGEIQCFCFFQNVSDDTKIGQRMMEKMGWEKGKGLGAKENGITEHIKASYKSDSRG